MHMDEFPFASHFIRFNNGNSVHLILMRTTKHRLNNRFKP